MLKEEFCWILVRSSSFVTLLEFRQRPDVGFGDDCLPSRHLVQQNLSFTGSEGSDDDLAHS
jgi:hypothetical protein